MLKAIAIALVLSGSSAMAMDTTTVDTHVVKPGGIIIRGVDTNVVKPGGIIIRGVDTNVVKPGGIIIRG